MKEVLHLYFEKPESFNAWLAENHSSVKELWLCYYKKHTGKPSITWEESVEEALCYGWIDGLRHRIDDERYKIRFTPRRKSSIWSTKNIATIKKIIKSGKINPPGLEAYNKRREEKSEIYGYEQKEKNLPANYEQQLRGNHAVFIFFNSMAPFSRKISIGWIVSAKKEETRMRRFETFLKCCESGELIPTLRWSKKR